MRDIATARDRPACRATVEAAVNPVAFVSAKLARRKTHVRFAVLPDEGVGAVFVIHGRVPAALRRVMERQLHPDTLAFAHAADGVFEVDAIEAPGAPERLLGRGDDCHITQSER